MAQKKYWLIGVITGLVVVGAGAVWFVIRSDDKVDLGAASLHETVAQSSGPSGPVPLGGRQAETSGGLSVSSNSASNLGQLTPSQQSGTGNSSGSGSASNSPDPSTFAQYEKYKNEPNALFGDIKAGTGAELTADKKAAVYYKGWLTNGQMFDQSRTGSDGKLEPFVFQMGAHQVITGWEQALYGMKVGGSRLVIVPPSVGYGASGQGSIPPNAVLVFEVQLLAVQ